MVARRRESNKPEYKEIRLTESQCAEGLQKLEPFIERREDGHIILNAEMRHVSGGKRSKRYSVSQNRKWFKPRFRVRMNLPEGRRRFNPKRLAYAIAHGGYLAEGIGINSTCDNWLCIAPEHLAPKTEAN